MGGCRLGHQRWRRGESWIEGRLVEPRDPPVEIPAPDSGIFVDQGAAVADQGNF
jgi:hypothetical protein